MDFKPQLDIVCALTALMFKPKVENHAKEAIIIALNMHDVRINSFILFHSNLLTELISDFIKKFKSLVEIHLSDSSSVQSLSGTQSNAQSPQSKKSHNQPLSPLPSPISPISSSSPSRYALTPRQAETKPSLIESLMQSLNFIESILATTANSILPCIDIFNSSYTSDSSVMDTFHSVESGNISHVNNHEGKHELRISKSIYGELLSIYQRDFLGKSLLALLHANSEQQVVATNSALLILLTALYSSKTLGVTSDSNNALLQLTLDFIINHVYHSTHPSSSYNNGISSQPQVSVHNDSNAVNSNAEVNILKSIVTRCGSISKPVSLSSLKLICILVSVSSYDQALSLVYGKCRYNYRYNLSYNESSGTSEQLAQVSQDIRIASTYSPRSSLDFSSVLSFMSSVMPNGEIFSVDDIITKLLMIVISSSNSDAILNIHANMNIKEMKKGSDVNLYKNNNRAQKCILANLQSMNKPYFNMSQLHSVDDDDVTSQRKKYNDSSTEKKSTLLEVLFSKLESFLTLSSCEEQLVVCRLLTEIATVITFHIFIANYNKMIDIDCNVDKEVNNTEASLDPNNSVKYDLAQDISILVDVLSHLNGLFNVLVTEHLVRVPQGNLKLSTAYSVLSATSSSDIGLLTSLMVQSSSSKLSNKMQSSNRSNNGDSPLNNSSNTSQSRISEQESPQNKRILESLAIVMIMFQNIVALIFAVKTLRKAFADEGIDAFVIYSANSTSCHPTDAPFDNFLNIAQNSLNEDGDVIHETSYQTPNKFQQHNLTSAYEDGVQKHFDSLEIRNGSYVDIYEDEEDRLEYQQIMHKNDIKSSSEIKNESESIKDIESTFLADINSLETSLESLINI